MTSTATPTSCLVLGGGGVTGIAWMTGLLFGLEEQGVNLRAIERIIGTSAGATVGAQISGQTSLHELYQRQINPEKQVGELVPKIRYFKLLCYLLPALIMKKDSLDLYRRLGEMAQALAAVSPHTRRQVIEDRLPEHHWPSRKLEIIAVDTKAGPVTFDAHSGIDLVDAVSASCAVPGVWPPVQIGARQCIDGGVSSSTNADCASGARHVLIIAPLADRKLAGQIQALQGAGSVVHVIEPDQPARKAMGRNPLNLTRREAAARAGYTQALSIADKVVSLMGLTS